jgi:hypothetical protein
MNNVPSTIPLLLFLPFLSASAYCCTNKPYGQDERILASGLMSWPIIEKRGEIDMSKTISVFLFICVCSALSAEIIPLKLELDTEFGFLGILKHKIRAGTTSDKGDVFNYKTQGSQDTLFPYQRYQADLEIALKHHAVLLYQPLKLDTQASIDDNFRYNEVDYAPEDDFLNLVYSFDFWRISYLYDWIEPDTGFFLSPGLSFQIRNAFILFRSESGKGSTQSNIGPVPIIKLRTGYRWPEGFFLLFDGDGFYASNRFINGADYSFTGYIYDLSLRGGYQFHSRYQAYLNLRFLGGGAKGSNDKKKYTYNDLHTFALSLGMKLLL